MPLLVASNNAFAEAVEIDGIYYNLVTKIKQAEVTKNPNKYTGTVNILETVTYNGVTYSVTSIGENAFNNCRGLTSVTIGNSVTSIGNNAFIDCYRLADIYCHAENMPSTKRSFITEFEVFNNSDIRKATLHVPAASIEQYKTTEPWSDFGTIVAIDDTETQAS